MLCPSVHLRKPLPSQPVPPSGSPGRIFPRMARNAHAGLDRDCVGRLWIVLCFVSALIWSFLVSCPNLFDKGAYLLAILLSISFDSAADVDSPRANLTDRCSYILHRQTSSEQDAMSSTGQASKLPILCLTTSSPVRCRRVKQQSPDYRLIALHLLLACLATD